VSKKIVEVRKKLTARQTGYLRLTKTGIRVGDKAVMTKMEFVFDEVKTDNRKQLTDNKKKSTKIAARKTKTTQPKEEISGEVKSEVNEDK